MNDVRHPYQVMSYAADSTVTKMNTLMLSPPVFGQLLQLGKPRVVSLIVFTAIIGMFRNAWAAAGAAIAVRHDRDRAPRHVSRCSQLPYRTAARCADGEDTGATVAER